MPVNENVRFFKPSPNAPRGRPGGRHLSICLCFLLLCRCGSEIDPRLAFERGDYLAALPIWQQRAEQDDPEAQNFLGTYYLLGLGVERDYAAAKEWYERAARHGHPDAQRNLGLMYEAGRGVPRDIANAYMWLYAAYRQGHPRAAPTIRSLIINLSPNHALLLRGQAREYIINDVRWKSDPNEDVYPALE